MFKNPVTHNGQFHADEVCAMAFLRLAGLLSKAVPITRSTEPKVWETADILIDIGSKYEPSTNRYDHHQASFTLQRPCGTQYAAFGLIVKHFYEHLMSKEEYADFDKRFVRLIDGADTGKLFHSGQVVTFQGIISGFLPLDTDEPHAFDAAFYQAVALAELVIKNQLEFTKFRVRSDRDVRRAVKESSLFDGQAVVLPARLLWKEVIPDEFPSVKVVIFKHLRGGWAAQVVPYAADGYDSQIKFPAEWAGLTNKELDSVAGLPGCKFCHKARFLIVHQTYDGIMEMVKHTLSTANR